MMLEWALRYAALGWPVFRITGFKTPLKGSHGHLDATTDESLIRKWWTERPASNIALACGDIVVIDLDGPGALAQLKALTDTHGPLPRTACVRSARGMHLYFKAPVGVHVRTRNAPRKTKGEDGIDIKAHGGWVVLPPSVNARNGFVYQWADRTPIAELPLWLPEALKAVDAKPVIASQFGELPDFLKNRQTNLASRTDQSLRMQWTAHNEARIRSALAAIPPDGYDEWVQIGMALHNLGWDRGDGSSAGFDIWDSWSQGNPEKYAPAVLAEKWDSFGRSGRIGVTVGTIFHMAGEAGWDGRVVAPEGVGAPLGKPVGASWATSGQAERVLNVPVHPEPGVGAEPPRAAQTMAAPFQPVNGFHSAPAVAPVIFPDTNDEGGPKATVMNTRLAVQALHIECRKDVFHEKLLVGGHPINQWAGDLSDDVVQMIRKIIRDVFGFDPNEKNTRDACVQLCLMNQFNPVAEYLDSLIWDGTPRLASWLHRYLGADQTTLNAAVGRLLLVAAVRRVRQPGTKFDQIVVLEGTQGTGKSTAVNILAGDDNFSDQRVLDKTEKEQQEASVGVWLHEIADLVGMKRAEIEHIKAFASRREDRARPAYGRFRVDRKRTCIYFATTNDDDYLKDETGNRRFWPVKTGDIDHAGLKEARDQLWAEAAYLEAQGASIVLDKSLWGDAEREQTSRMEIDPYTEGVMNYLAMEQGRDDVSAREVLVENPFIAMAPDRLNSNAIKRAGRILRNIGFTRYRKREGSHLLWRFRRHAGDVIS